MLCTLNIHRRHRISKADILNGQEKANGPKNQKCIIIKRFNFKLFLIKSFKLNMLKILNEVYVRFVSLKNAT